jgi:hypothetical protein
VTPLQIQSAFGLIALAALARAAGGFRRPVPWRAVIAGLALQLALGAALLHIPPLRAAFGLVGTAVDALTRATQAGTSLIFGYLGGAPLSFAEARPGRPSSCSSRPFPSCCWWVRSPRCSTTGGCGRPRHHQRQHAGRLRRHDG